MFGTKNYRIELKTLLGVFLVAILFACNSADLDQRGSQGGENAGDSDSDTDADSDADADTDGSNSSDTSDDADGGDSDIDHGPPVIIDECPGNLDAQTVAALEGGGPIDPKMKWLYPYDKTVFPYGLLPPVLQWAPQIGGAEAVMLVMRSELFEYKGCFGPQPDARITVDEDVWKTAFDKSLGVSDPLTVELTTLAKDTVSGPISETWTLALGSLKGAIYYNTYESAKAMGSGAVLRIKPGAKEPQAFLTVLGAPLVGPCVSCHALSADGSTMLASKHAYPQGPYSSASYNLQANPTPNPPKLKGGLNEAGFGALYPDGSLFMTNGSPSITSPMPFPLGPGNVPGMLGPRTSRLYNTANGNVLNAPGWNVQYAKMPMFSPDGKKIAFNQHGASNGRTLSVMDFDVSTRTFSNLEVIFQHESKYPGWPMFTPDGKQVVFVLGNKNDYASWSPGSQGDLYIVDIETKTATELKQANGFMDGDSYLPRPGRDEHLNFYPTVAPTACAGYFWVYFTSRRTYGNIIEASELMVTTKKIWVSAVSINAAPGTDPSHPAFYLPGQELQAGSIRAFPTLEPCKPTGEECETGLDCCDGFCIDGYCGEKDECSNIDEKCEVDEDCCDPEAACIGGYCAYVAPV